MIPAWPESAWITLIPSVMGPSKICFSDCWRATDVSMSLATASSFCRALSPPNFIEFVFSDCDVENGWKTNLVGVFLIGGPDGVILSLSQVKCDATLPDLLDR